MRVRLRLLESMPTTVHGPAASTSQEQSGQRALWLRSSTRFRLRVRVGSYGWTSVE